MTDTFELIKAIGNGASMFLGSAVFPFLLGYYWHKYKINKYAQGKSITLSEADSDYLVGRQSAYDDIVQKTM